MSEIVTAVLTQTVGLIVNKGRDVVAEKLEGGDVTDETIRRWIVREIGTVTSKLNALIRKDLNTSIFHFRTGLTYLFDVLNKTRSCSIPMQAAAGSEELSNEERLRSHSGPVAVNIIETLDAWKTSIVLDDEDKRALSNAKEGFRQAALYASEAFSIENLETSDCLKARAIFVAAKILENVDHPKDAVTACKTCLEDLHDMSSVKNNFKVALNNGFWRARFRKKDRRKIISSVCHVNRVIHDVMQTVCVTIDQEKHCVDIGKETLVDTLRDVRVIQTLLKTEIGHCCVTPRELGEEGEDPERTLKMPQGIATDGQGRFIVGENDDHNVKLKVFDRSGSFLRSICHRPTVGHDNTELSIRDIATDNQDNIYVLGNQPTGSHCYMVYVFDTSFNVNRTFSVKASRGSTMTINSRQQQSDDAE